MTDAAAAMTYDSLVDDVKAYIERGDENDVTVLRQIPRVIANTQRTLADKLKIQGYLNAFVSAMESGVPVIAKPDGWRTTVSINYGTGALNNDRRILRARGYEYIRSLYPNDTSLGAPEFYSDYNLTHWLVGPTPADAYPFEAMVYCLPPLLSESNQQNYLTQYAPFLLLYSCLAGMEPFLRNDARIATWQGLADDNFKAIDLEDIGRMVDRGQLRSTD